MKAALIDLHFRQMLTWCIDFNATNNIQTRARARKGDSRTFFSLQSEERQKKEK